MTNLNLYKVFCAVAKCGNITKASEILFVSQPAISNAIKELEQQLGGQLFIRKNKGVVLTGYGKEIFLSAEKCIEKLTEFDTYFDKIKKMQTGILRIGTNTSNTTQDICKYITKFASIFPDVKIYSTKSNIEDLKSKLNRQELDIIFVDSSSNEEDSEFELVKTYPIEYCLVGNLDYFNKYKDDALSCKNFPCYDLVLPSKNNSSRKIIEENLSKQNIFPTPKYQLDDYKMIFEMVKQGLGVAFVNTKYYQNEIGKSIFVLNSEIKFSREISALKSKQTNNPTLNQFIDIMLD